MVSNKCGPFRQAFVQVVKQVDEFLGCFEPRRDTVLDRVVFEVGKNIGNSASNARPIGRLIAVLRVEEKFFKQLMPVMQKYGNLALGVLNYLRLLIPANTLTSIISCQNHHCRMSSSDSYIALQELTDEERLEWMQDAHEQLYFCKDKDTTKY